MMCKCKDCGCECPFVSHIVKPAKWFIGLILKAIGVK